MKIIQVTAALIRKDEKLLICQRGADGELPLLWEFPGGKLEAGETLEECLIRECKEELDVDIRITGIYAKTEYQYPKRTVALAFYSADIVQGEIKPIVHNDVKWVLPDELKDFEFCPADVEIVKELSK
jgi:8-oxo-dGTP diphosphatase